MQVEQPGKAIAIFLVALKPQFTFTRCQSLFGIEGVPPAKCIADHKDIADFTRQRQRFLKILRTMY